MKNLYRYQVEGVDFLRARKSALLFDDPGLGKTVQLISALPADCAAVVVCPSSVKMVWEAELKAERPDLTVSVLSGRNSFRWPELHEVVVLNYDILPDYKTITAPPRPTHALFDEAHFLKNPSAARSQKAGVVGRLAVSSGGACWGATGTPLASHPPDLWGVTVALGLSRAIWGDYKRFFWLFRGFQTQWGAKWGKPREEVPGYMAPHCLGRRREDVLPQLPVKTHRKIAVRIKRVTESEGIDDSQLMADFDKGNTGAAVSKARAALALAKAESKEVQELLDLWIEEAPLVIFSSHREAVIKLAQRYDTIAVTGGLDGSTRERIVTDFRSGKTRVILGTSGAMGTGLTLTESYRVARLDLAWTPAENRQAEDRVCRIGQTRGVEIIDFVAENNSLDDRVYRLLKAKEKIIDLSIEAART